MRLTSTLILGCLLLAASKNYAQCGTDPTSGVTAPTGSSIIVNNYYPSTATTALNATSLTLGTLDARGAANTLAIGDLVVIIQMQGADINNSNDDTYGDGQAGLPGSGYLTTNLVAGNYEYATLSSVSGLTIGFSAPLAKRYFHTVYATGTASQNYQVLRVPRYYDFNLASGSILTAPVWNGATGGVVIVDAANTMTINGTIDVNGRGFRGAGGRTFNGSAAAIANTDFRWNSPITTAANTTGGSKGEGIAGTPSNILITPATTITPGPLEGYVAGSMGRGAPANAGGGGTDGQPSSNSLNTGGGGGGNGGAGGRGGSGWHNLGSGTSSIHPYGGNGGSAYAERSVTRFVMGGGGGAGTANNSDAADQYLVSGGAGGGIILLRAKLFASAGTGILTANGSAATGILAGGKTDGVGGGGAGGTIVAITRASGTTGLGNITARANGGRGGNSEGHFDHGPGGGGGGGVLISNGTFLNPVVTAGGNGLTRSTSAGGPIDNPYGTTAAFPGVIITLPGAPIFTNASFFPSACGILPVRLESFTASLSGNSTLLNWEVAQAIDFAGFDVEYSTDGFNFVAVGDLPFRSSQSKYEFVHAGNNSAVSYYRLRLKDNSGKSEYSKILTIRQNTSNKTLMLYPQPAKGFTTVQVSATNKQLVLVQVFNTNGSRVAQKQVQLGAGNNIFLIDNLEKLSSGLYTVRVTIDGKPQQAKLIISN